MSRMLPSRADQRVGRCTPFSGCLLACQDEATGARARKLHDAVHPLVSKVVGRWTTDPNELHSSFSNCSWVAPMECHGMRQVGEFHLAIYDVKYKEWEEMKCVILIKHIPSDTEIHRTLHISKDDYLFRRTNILERDQKCIAEYLLSLARIIVRRRSDKFKQAKIRRVGICIEEIELIDWNDTTGFEKRYSTMVV
jgi:hypothetical protein